MKIDKSFVDDLATNATSVAIVRAIVALGQSMNISVIAEGVETNAQWTRLTDIGVQRMQGYLFAKPMELNLLEERLKQLAFGNSSSAMSTNIKLVK